MILASIKPYYYYLIGEGKKKIEVRKTTLKNLPQDIVFYMSKDEKSFAKIPKEFQEKYRKHFGKVGLKVVCNEVEEFHEWELCPQGKFANFERERLKKFLTDTCLSLEEIVQYRKNLIYCKPLYGWHISDLKIYDKPKELREFYTIDESGSDCCCGCVYNETPLEEMPCRTCTGERRYLYRPPRSYMYVEELK